jgi:hypothetical protein
MLRDMLAAIARKDYEAAAASAKLGVAPRPARGGAPLSPVTFSVVAGPFLCPPDPQALQRRPLARQFPQGEP